MGCKGSRVRIPPRRPVLTRVSRSVSANPFVFSQFTKPLVTVRLLLLRRLGVLAFSDFDSTARLNCLLISEHTAYWIDQRPSIRVTSCLCLTLELCDEAWCWECLGSECIRSNLYPRTESQLATAQLLTKGGQHGRRRDDQFARNGFILVLLGTLVFLLHQVET